MNTSKLPHVRRYALVFFIATLSIVAYALFGRAPDNIDATAGMSTLHFVRNGILSAAVMTLTVFIAHLGVTAANAAQSTKTQLSASSVVGSSVDGESSSVDKITALQVRGLGITIDHLGQSEIWQHIQRKGDTHASIFSNAAADYPSDHDTRESLSALRIGSAFKSGAGEAVEYWPIPVVAVGPRKDPTNDSTAAFSIASARQKASLAFQLFLSQESVNDTGSATPLEDLFRFFDEHPDVPAAVIFSSDGMVVRNYLGKPGSGLTPDGPAVPKVLDSAVALLVARPDRVDRLIRPFVVKEPQSVDMRETQFDIVKMWNLYWDETEAFDTDYAKKLKEHGSLFPVGPHIMTTAWWQSKLPGLWAQTENKGPGDFRKNPWLPVRWTTWQLQEFDESPVLGYLGRPIRAPLKDQDNAWLKHADQATSIREGWEAAQQQGTQHAKPERIFFDTSANREWVIPLSQALNSGPESLSPTDLHDGYDVGYRIGDTGVSSALVEIGLALMAGYGDGKASAAVSVSDHGFAEISIVTPPTAAEKAKNALHRGDDPFNYR
ncbi:DUF2875 domain-containing protein [Paraburkholderia sp. 1N]|uniref:DUF2875 domain-containing protein n=1 Tax=Paraburkholderia solitsugae TaxID=2675748 RepID=A0ABX2BPR4_9BURK|nr:DUF2875 family protein [Paraburkholderia solitsugae]NPT41790.1 DUF2875 domain-containing protein [Paraburkholderia solitsugae]